MPWRQARRAAAPRMNEGVTLNAQRSTLNVQVMDEEGGMRRMNVLQS